MRVNPKLSIVLAAAMLGGLAGFGLARVTSDDRGSSQDQPRENLVELDTSTVPRPDGAIPARKCPQANAVFEEMGLDHAPHTYYPDCPDPDELRADLAHSQEDTSAPDVMRQALREGRIREEQNPCTYPDDLRAAIDLSDEDCARLAETLAEQYQ